MICRVENIVLLPILAVLTGLTCSACRLPTMSLVMSYLITIIGDTDKAVYFDKNETTVDGKNITLRPIRHE
jgi:hypothetical protein